jgi:hypothetical protein
LGLVLESVKNLGVWKTNERMVIVFVEERRGRGW